MTENLKRLYHEIIKKHNDDPYHFEKRIGEKETIKAYNPVCGDRFELYLQWDARQVLQFHFHGFGCAISKASTSLLAKTIEGKSPGAALIICNNFLRYVKNELKKGEGVMSPQFLAFAALQEYPERYDCATLSWIGLRAYLEKLTLE